MIAPDTNGPVTSVAFFRAGIEVVCADVPGYLLELDLPSSVELRRQADGRVHLLEDPDPLVECCGRLLLPWVNRNGPGTTPLDIPPPHPFDAHDLQTMWSARNRLVAARRPPTSGDADWARLRHSVGREVDWQVLERAVLAAGALLGGWPTRVVPAVQWLPFDRGGGRLLVGVTERASRSHALPAGTWGAPALTARRSTRAQPRTLHALAAVAGLLADGIREVPGIDQDPEIRDRLMGLFRRVAHRSNPPTPVADPPPSSWPATLAATYSACVRALTAVTAIGPGSGTAPLSELWELYQAWCAESLLSALSQLLGPGTPVAPGSTCIGSWRDGAADVELHYQPRVTTSGSFRALGEGYVAAISDLEPDLLLIRRDGLEVRRLVLDPKKRSGALSADDLTINASKYLWGIRVESMPAAVPVIEGVVLLAPLGGAVSATREGQGDTATAHPARGINADFARAVLDSVRGRPHLPAAGGWHASWA